VHLWLESETLPLVLSANLLVTLTRSFVSRLFAFSLHKIEQPRPKIQTCEEEETPALKRAFFAKNQALHRSLLNRPASKDQTLLSQWL
jgi:hypothetical protein